MRQVLLVIGFVLAMSVPAWAQEEFSVSKIYLGTPTLSSGTGSPEGVVTAPVGSTFWRTDTATVYLKTAGSGNTGWSAISAAPYTTGDLLIATNSSTLGKLGIVPVGQVLASGSIPTWTASPSLTSIGGAANLTLNPTGDLVLGPTGNDVLPSSGYTKNLGALTNKYLSLHAAELWVETLVAQDTMATIGGRVLVGPTTTLTSDLSAGATSIAVKHNQMASGDRVFLQANGKYEAMAMTSGPSGSGPYTYSVTRNLDGSGANDWTAGDAVFNTGTTGDGFIDLYSINGLIPGSTAGPTIVGNVRTGTTYSAIAPRWAIGNLNGLYGYGSDIYGAAFGDASNSYLTIDATNGIRMIGDAGTMFSMDTSGNATFAGRLTVGTGRNLLQNTEFRRESSTGFGNSTGNTPSTTGPRTGINGSWAGGSSAFWKFATYSGSGSPVWQFFCNQASGFPIGGGACRLFAGTATPSASSSKDVFGPAYAAAATERFEFSYYVFFQGGVASAAAGLLFYDASDNLLSGTAGTAVTSSPGPITAISGYTRVGTIQTAPSSTAYVVPYIRLTYPSSPSANPSVTITRLFLGIAGPGQTEHSPWAPGGTSLIDGTMLATDMVLTNTLHGGSATDLTTGTGFWLDATSTPTFRVGVPGANEVRWDGTDLTVRSANFTADASGVRIAPVDNNVFEVARSYGWTVSNGSLGVSGSDGSSFGRNVFIESTWNGTGSRTAAINITADYAGSVGSPNTATLDVSATSAGSGVTINATTFHVASGETFLAGVGSDGTGKVVCVRSNGFLGTCTTAVGAGGTCTCG